MEIPIYQVDAFTDKLFCGNPAAVCILPQWLPDQILKSITLENNLPATAFLVQSQDSFQIRCFTPDEVPLCGHGTLAAAYVIFKKLRPESKSIEINAQSTRCVVSQQSDLITLLFPATMMVPCVAPPCIAEGLGITPIEMYQHDQERCVIVVNTAAEVFKLTPNFELLKRVNYRGIVVTAPGTDVDFVSRTFYPNKIISEDPVTGISHCLLAPYWAKKLNKQSLTGYQASSRGGTIHCKLEEAQVLISGKAALYMQGTIDLSSLHWKSSWT